MNFLNLDSKFVQALNRLFDLVMLNLIFILTSIPIVTIGSSLTALYYVTLKMVKNEESYIWKSYLRSWLENFKQATAIWFLIVGVFLLLVIDFVTLNQTNTFLMYLKYIFVSLLIILIMVSMFVFPVLARFENTVRNTIYNCVFMAFRHLPWTLLIALANFAFPVCILLLPGKLSAFISFIMMLTGFSCISYLNAWIFINKIFPHYDKTSTDT